MLKKYKELRKVLKSELQKIKKKCLRNESVPMQVKLNQQKIIL